MTRHSCPGCGIAFETSGRARLDECRACGTALGLSTDDHVFRCVLTEDRLALRVVVQGEIDLVTAPMLERQLEDALASGRELVEVDLSGVTFMDARGVSVLVAARKAAGDATSLRLHAPSDAVVRMLDLCGIGVGLART